MVFKYLLVVINNQNISLSPMYKLFSKNKDAQRVFRNMIYLLQIWELTEYSIIYIPANKLLLHSVSQICKAHFF